MEMIINVLWKMMQSKYKIIQEIGIILWIKFKQRYLSYFSRIRLKLLNNLYSIDNRLNFHDFYVKEVIYNLKSLNERQIKFHIYDYYNDYGKNLSMYLVYDDVSYCRINFNKSDLPLSWGNDVFYFSKENKFVHKVILSDNSNFSITFKKLNVIIEDKK